MAPLPQAQGFWENQKRTSSSSGRSTMLRRPHQCGETMEHLTAKGNSGLGKEHGAFTEFFFFFLSNIYTLHTFTLEVV